MPVFSKPQGEPQTSSGGPRPSRQRARTVKGALYDEELVKENQVPKRKVTKRPEMKQTVKNSMSGSKTATNAAQSTILKKTAHADSDPFADVDDGESVEAPGPLQSVSINTPFRTSGICLAKQNILGKRHLESIAKHRTPKPTQTSKKNQNKPKITDEEWQAAIVNRGIKLKLKRSGPGTPHTEHMSEDEDEDLSTPITPDTMPPVPAPSPVSHGQPQALSEDDTNADTKTRRNRPRLGDLEPKYRGMALAAFPEYRCILASQCPYPNTTEDHIMAGTALKHASATFKLWVEDDTARRIIIALILQRNAQLRSELRGKAIPLVQCLYGFKKSGSQQSIAANQKLYKALKTNDSFLFKDPLAHTGLYEHPSIQEILNSMWFENLEDEGIKFEKYFTPLPLKTLALIFTTVEYIIDQWSNGRFEPSNHFTIKAYRAVYQKHLSNLEAAINHSNAAKEKLARIRQRLLDCAQRNAGVTLTQSFPTFKKEYFVQFEREDNKCDDEKNSEADSDASEFEADASDGSSLSISGSKRRMHSKDKPNKRQKTPKPQSLAEGTDEDEDGEYDGEDEEKGNDEGGGEGGDDEDDSEGDKSDENGKSAEEDSEDDD